ncbi:hypothetical protein DUNSADRAFT_3386 [Dunaliella salina]|uniref:Uncharacterized protein n=1 Tax=Dunaliella salina TaxID=3046 RepID=A0ABQ7FVF7_DUNSA|nr:hypothetical protein DUNSADRAFT_3386 [Dunaliella salina]|eukprot:KAF5826372.1 hypothetical protein DUNSADRAFT_3386 [Dunaliella salina]
MQLHRHQHQFPPIHRHHLLPLQCLYLPTHLLQCHQPRHPQIPHQVPHQVPHLLAHRRHTLRCLRHVCSILCFIWSGHQMRTVVVYNHFFLQ